VDTIPTSANVEDHVSMGVTAGLKLRQINDNVERILAIELLAAAQGIDFRKRVLGPDAQLGAGTRHAYALLRELAPFLESDDVLYPLIEAVRQAVASGQVVEAVEAGIGEESAEPFHGGPT
jgi:histidine ammonia-lyase